MSNRKTILAWRRVAAGLTLLPVVACISSSSSNPDGGGASSGSASSSGSAGSGSTATDSGTGSCPAPPTGAVLVDDMETGMGSILVAGGRTGAWYTYNDLTPTGTQTPIPMTPFKPAALNPARCTSHFAAETAGMGFTTWGAGVGFNFNDPGNGEGGSAKSTYDASAFTGIGFYAKAANAVVSSAVTVSVTDDQTDPAGGICNPTGTSKATNQCNDAFAISFGTSPLPALTADWQWVQFKWTDLKQQGFGQAFPNGLDVKKIYALHFQVPTASTFDFFIDDVYLLP